MEHDVKPQINNIWRCGYGEDRSDLNTIRDSSIIMHRPIIVLGWLVDSSLMDSLEDWDGIIGIWGEDGKQSFWPMVSDVVSTPWRMFQPLSMLATMNSNSLTAYRPKFAVEPLCISVGLDPYLRARL